MAKDKNRRKKMASDEEIEKVFNSVRITLVKTEPPQKTTPTPEKVALVSGINLDRHRR